MHEDKFLVQLSRVYPVIAYYPKTINNKRQGENDQEIFRDQSLIQRNTKLAAWNSKRKTNSLHLRDPCNRFSMLKSCFFFLEFTARMCGFVLNNLKNLKTVRFWNQIFNSTTLLGLINSSNTYCCKEEFPESQSLLWSNKAQLPSSQP